MAGLGKTVGSITTRSSLGMKADRKMLAVVRNGRLLQQWYSSASHGRAVQTVTWSGEDCFARGRALRRSTGAVTPVPPITLYQGLVARGSLRQRSTFQFVTLSCNFASGGGLILLLLCTHHSRTVGEAKPCLGQGNFRIGACSTVVAHMGAAASQSVFGVDPPVGGIVPSYISAVGMLRVLEGRLRRGRLLPLGVDDRLRPEAVPRLRIDHLGSTRVPIRAFWMCRAADVGRAPGSVQAR
jgi:hypothetical protein